VPEPPMSASTKAGRYELIEEIGRGAMGVVYRANDPVIGRPVAVKTMRLANAGNGLSHEDLLSRFQTEARAAGRLTHPNIVVVYDAGEEDGVLYITMELVEGPSLQALIEARQTFPLPRILRLMEQACSALDFAHQHKIVHRDIKPANLMLTADDTLKITDFGTAKILQFGTTQTAQTIGTPSYMSPEQIKGRPVDGRTDIFSLGVVLYELVTGHKPFPGDSVTTVIYKIVNEDPVPPRELDSSIHPGLSAVITKALAKSAELRFQDCREFIEALQHYSSYQEPSTEETLVLPRGAMPGAPAVETGRMLAMRGGVPAQIPAAARTQHPTGRTQGRLTAGGARKSRGTAWLGILLVAVIAVAGYQVYPALLEVWQRSQPDRVAAESALRVAKLTPKPPDIAAQTPPSTAAADASDQSATQPSEAAAPTAPQSAQLSKETAIVAADSAAAPAEPEKKPQPGTTDRPLKQPGVVAAAQEVAAPANAKRETPVQVKEPLDQTTPNQKAAAIPNQPSAPVNPPATPSYKPARLPPTQVAAAWQTRIWRILVQSGIDSQVQAVASGNTIVLTGKLRLPAHRRLLDRLQEVPDRIQIVDDIDYTLEQTPDNSSDAPAGLPPNLSR